MLARRRTARDEFFFYDNDSHTAEHLRTKMRTMMFSAFSCDFLLAERLCFGCCVVGAGVTVGGVAIMSGVAVV